MKEAEWKKFLIEQLDQKTERLKAMINDGTNSVEFSVAMAETKTALKSIGNARGLFSTGVTVHRARQP